MIPNAAQNVVKELKDAGFQAFLVGGCVRDMLRGVDPHDFDIATSATPEQVIALFPHVVPTGIAHGTVTVIVKAPRSSPEAEEVNSHFEVTTFRSEGTYTDGRRPDSVKFETDIKADLSRRDFTMNAMAYDPTTETLVDPFRGAEDLKKGIIRAVGDPTERFNEDGLRCMRAIRFAATFGFGIETTTWEAIGGTLPIFKKVAIERIQEEFFKVLLSPGVERGLVLLRTTGLLKAFLPGVETGFSRLTALPADLEVRLAMLVKFSTSNIESLNPLKLPTRTVARIATLLDNPMPRGKNMQPPTDKELRVWLRAIGPSPESITQAVSMGCELLPETMERLGRLAKDPVFHNQLALDGNEIMSALGITRGGPAVGHATRFLMNLVMEDPSQNTPELLKKALEGLDAQAPVL